MTDYATVARPYAKAAFAAASAESGLAEWSEALGALATAVAEPQIAERFDDPGIEKTQWAEALLASIPNAGDKLKNFVAVLADNRRLAALPEVADQFDVLRAEAEQTLDVEVSSAVAMDDSQLERLSTALKARFNREIRINMTQDPSLIGGAVIRAGDQVIDGSVRTKLEQLASNLAR